MIQNWIKILRLWNLESSRRGETLQVIGIGKNFLKNIPMAQNKNMDRQIVLQEIEKCMQSKWNHSKARKSLTSICLTVVNVYKKKTLRMSNTKIAIQSTNGQMNWTVLKVKITNRWEKYPSSLAISKMQIKATLRY